MTAAPFERVDVVPDSPAWEDERRQSLGASDVPAIMGLSPYASALDVYRTKLGVDRGMDPELAFIGHAQEPTVSRWLRRFHPELGVIRRGFMARSVEAAFPLHATFDRFLVKRREWVPVQIKTAHQFAGDAWEDDAVPVPVQAQVQAELYVHGGDLAYAVAFVGGRRFHLRPIARDEEWIRDLMLPQAERFWREHVEARVPPDPVSSAEAVSLWPGSDGELIADDVLRRLVEDLRSAKATVARADALRDELALEIQKRMRDATTLLDPAGTVLATWKPTAASTYTVTRKPGRRFVLKGEASA